jgi:hypothetical protein
MTEPGPCETCGHAPDAHDHEGFALCKHPGCICAHYAWDPLARDLAHRPLTDEERTDTLLNEFDGDVTLICGCSFWREESDNVAGYHDDAIKVRWCERHAPFHLYDKAGVHYA